MRGLETACINNGMTEEERPLGFKSYQWINGVLKKGFLLKLSIDKRPINESQYSNNNHYY